VVVRAEQLQSPPRTATLASMIDRDRDRDGGGLAVLMLAGFLVLLLLTGVGGVAWIFVRQAQQARMQLIMQEELAARAVAESARARLDAAEAAAKAADSAIENPAPSAPESPPPTQ